jgi:protoporphyrinogen oxidase
VTVFILGGGPAGLAVANGLTDSQTARFVVVERGKQLGGLATTIAWAGIGSCDLGPHKIFTTDAALMARVAALLPKADWLVRDKISSIYMRGHYIPYPPSPFSLVRVFGPVRFLGMLLGYAGARVRAMFGAREPQTFEEDLTGRLGPDLYEHLFKPIALKLWGDPTRLDVKLSRGRIQTPSLVEVIARLLKLRQTSDFEALTFRYPQGGLRRLWDSIEAKGQSHGSFLCDHTVDQLEVRDGRITRILCRRAGGDAAAFDVSADDFVVSTLPLSLTSHLLRDHLGSTTVQLVNEVIALNDLLLVYLHVNVPSLLEESWVFVPDPDIVFHRVSEQESFDPGMTPDGSIVCCEVMSSETRPLNAKSDQELIDACKAGLARMGYRGFEVRAARVIRLPRSYPVFRPGFEGKLDRILTAFDRIANFRTVGRQGSFSYIGTLDAMDMGYGCARWLDDRGADAWERERVRTRHYPVLD